MQYQEKGLTNRDTSGKRQPGDYRRQPAHLGNRSRQRKKIVDESGLYLELEKIFTRFAIPVLLIAFLLIIDHYIKPVTERAVVIFRPEQPVQLIETTAGSFYRSFDNEIPSPLSGDSITLFKTPVLGIIQAYEIQGKQGEPSQSFTDYIGIAWILVLLSLITLIRPGQDIRLLAGGLSLVGLVILLLVYAVLRN